MLVLAMLALQVQAGPIGDSTRVVPLEEITVTATRERAVAPPVATTEVAPEVLQRVPARNGYDLVRQAAGIEVHEQGQGPGFASDAVIRGFTSDHSSDVLLVIDGVPINLPIHGHVEGYADWSVLSPAGVSALRVIHGPASPLYGDFAVGGVVEAFTAADANGTAGALAGTSYGDAGGWVRTGGRGGTGGWMAALDGRRQEGWRQNDGYWLGNGLLRGWRRLGVGRLEGGLMAYGSTWDSPGFVSVDRYNADDVERAVDPTDGGDARRLIGHLRYGRPLGGATLESSLWGQVVRSSVFLNIPHDGEVSQSDEEDRRHAVGGQAQLSWRPGAGELSVGISGRADWSTYDLYDTRGRARVSPRQANDARYQAGGAFVRWRGMLGSRLLYDLGGRLDALHYESLDRLDGSDAWRTATHVLPSPKLGARYLLNGEVALLASLSRGFRGPIGVISEPDRHPTITWAKEVGVAYTGRRLELQAALFQQDVAHERILDPVTREIVDAGQSRRRGVSLDAGVAVGERLRLTGELTINDVMITGVARPRAVVVPALRTAGLGLEDLRPRFHDVPLPPGSKVPGVADYLGRVGADLAAGGGLELRGLLRFSGPYAPIGEPEVRTRSYAVAELGASLRLRPIGGTLDLDVLNLLDSKYPELRASGFLNPGSPRTLRVGVRFDEVR